MIYASSNLIIGRNIEKLMRMHAAMLSRLDYHVLMNSLSFIGENFQSFKIKSFEIFGC